MTQRVRRETIGVTILLVIVAVSLWTCDFLQSNPDAQALSPADIALPESRPASAAYPFDRDG